MREITTLKEVQEVTLRILRYFKSFCREHDISFMLAYGTLLGAVRHKGFIPWDDDVDVMLTRSEYIKLVEAAKGADILPFEFLLPELSDDYFAPLGKIADTRTLVIQDYGYQTHRSHGLYVDIFVIDSIPTNQKEAVSFYKKANRLRLMWLMSVRDLAQKSSSIKNYFLRLPISLFSKLFGWKYWRNKYISFCQSINEEEKAGVIIYGEGLKKECFDSESFKDLSTVTFEGEEYKAPKDVNLYLTQMYGDYMCIPKESERKIHPNRMFYL